MSKKILTTAEKWEIHQRDLAAYRQRSLFRRSHERFRRDLWIVPHIFLAWGKSSMAPLLKDEETIVKAFRGRAVWTLDTAARLVTGRGFLTSPDLIGYLTVEDLDLALRQGLIGAPLTAGLTVDPLYRRPPMLIVHVPDEPIPAVELPSGDRVVPWDFLAQDLMGTLGWRPDLLTRLEATYPAALPQ